jgi:hypothetical protein
MADCAACPSYPPTRYVVDPIVADDTSDSGVGRWPITVPCREPRSKACTMFVLDADPPPKISSRLPMSAPAASWNTWGTVPS